MRTEKLKEYGVGITPKQRKAVDIAVKSEMAETLEREQRSLIDDTLTSIQRVR